MQWVALAIHLPSAALGSEISARPRAAKPALMARCLELVVRWECYYFTFFTVEAILPVCCGHPCEAKILTLRLNSPLRPNSLSALDCCSLVALIFQHHRTAKSYASDARTVVWPAILMKIHCLRRNLCDSTPSDFGPWVAHAHINRQRGPLYMRNGLLCHHRRAPRYNWPLPGWTLY